MSTIKNTINNVVEKSGMSIDKIFFVSISIILVIIVINWIYSKLSLNSKNCKRLDKIYPTKPSISPINYSHEDYKDMSLRDYYVKSAYNCCAAGDYKNDYVNTCALKTCIEQGARFLDFEIYSISGQPVISVSSKNNYNIKQSYNSIPLGEAMKIINRYAFSSGYCPNSTDPLILHFRIMSNIVEMYDVMANILLDSFNNRLLGKKYSFSTYNSNFGAVKIKELKSKVVIMVDNKNDTFKQSNTLLNELVNLNSNNSKLMQTLRYYDIKNTHEPNDLLFNNKQYMTACIPDLNQFPTNYSSALCMYYGCQFIAMAFQKNDNNMIAYNKYFDSKNSAFVLKPEKLRYIPKFVEIKGPPPDKVSYGTRTTEYDFIDGPRDFNI